MCRELLRGRELRRCDHVAHQGGGVSDLERAYAAGSLAQGGEVLSYHGASGDLRQSNSCADDQLAVLHADAFHILRGGHVYQGLGGQLTCLYVNHHVRTASNDQRVSLSAQQGVQGFGC